MFNVLQWLLARRNLAVVVALLARRRSLGRKNVGVQKYVSSGETDS